MKKSFILTTTALALFFAGISGCATLQMGSRVGKIQTDSIKGSAGVLLASAEDFKTCWPVASGFIRGLYEPYPDQDMPPRIRALLSLLDGISARALEGTWQDCDKGEAVGALVRLEGEAARYVLEERGPTLLNYIRSVSGFGGL